MDASISEMNNGAAGVEEISNEFPMETNTSGGIPPVPQVAPGNVNPTLQQQPSRPPRELKVEDALLYLDQVKMEFHDKPHIYNEFLEIMKNFKAQSINTPGVIERVKNLFRGYNKLILGFNTFLPEGEGYKIELTPEEEAYGKNGPPQEVLQSGMHQQYRPQIGDTHQKIQPHLVYAGNPFPIHANVAGSSGVHQQQLQPPPSTLQPQSQSQPNQQPHQQPQPAPASNLPLHLNPSMEADNMAIAGFSKPPQQMQQQHAISYVTTIRNRFAKEPDTYRAFLKILHTYQKEQKGIKEVLEQVSELFADHPDLLMEFTYFLPDAVQDQAKERLHRAAKESVVRRKMAAKTTAMLTKSGMSGGLPSPTSSQHQQQQPAPQQNSAPVGVKRPREKETREKEGPLPKEKAPRVQSGHQPVAGKKNSRGKKEHQSHSPPPPSVTFFHASAERRLLDQIKDLLTGTTREPWTEFVRCLELFNQQLIDRSNMLHLVQELFNTSDLYEEFKTLMDNRTNYETKGHEVWFAIPLSEIDFSQCRKCTPSYRALPKDFPAVQSSESTPADLAVLNSQWVSIPIGSEESYSFKHMRKNQYEESLFKCEDERFEIDMIIDSNMCTIKLLEPIAEEINTMRVLETSDKGSAALKFNFQLEKRSVSTIHLNSISRIYGDQGQEILELLRKNPAGTIPVVLRRLKQKDYEWRRARQDLDRQWREQLDRNYEKAFDHRSFYFKQQDRRSYSPRHLVGDIKSRSSGLGLSDADEELLTSVGVTISVHNSLVAVTPASFHLYLLFDSVDPSVGELSHHHHVIHKDVYRVLCYAAECASLSQNDKERISALWRDFLKLFFSMPVHYLHSAAMNYGDEPEELGEDHVQAWIAGTRVLTLYGHGEVLEFRGVDGMYKIKLAYGTGFLTASSIIGAEQLSVPALHALGVSIDPETGVEKIFNVAQAGIPSPANIVSDPCRVFYGTQTCYVFLRLYHTIFTRLLYAKQLCTEVSALHEKDPQKTHRKSSFRSRPVYNSFVGQLMGSIDGSLDSNRYEESLRLLLGNKSYMLLNLDKVVLQALKSLHVMANDDNVTKLVGLFIYHRTRASRVDVSLYQAHVAQVLSNTLEEVYRLQVLTSNQTTTQVGCQFLGVLASAHAEYTSAIERVPQRGLIDEMPEEEDNHVTGGVSMDALFEEEADEHSVEDDPAGLLSSMMSMG